MEERRATLLDLAAIKGLESKKGVKIFEDRIMAYSEYDGVSDRDNDSSSPDVEILSFMKSLNGG